MFGSYTAITAQVKLPAAVIRTSDRSRQYPAAYQSQNMALCQRKEINKGPSMQRAARDRKVLVIVGLHQLDKDS